MAEIGEPRIHVLGVSGSLRRDSYNTASLYAAQRLLPEGMSLDIFSLAGLPLYNADVEAAGIPPAVQTFKDRIAEADALLLATPEYNYSVPGVLKNAIDWASRPSGKSPLNRKPTAIIGATTGNFGTTRAQMHLRTICQYNDMFVVNLPEVLIMKAQERFNDHGELTDAVSRDLLRKLLLALAELTLMLRSEQRHMQPA